MAKELTHKIVSVEGDRERMQLRPEIYVIDRHKTGALHCIYEVIDNAIDEARARHSSVTEISIEYDDVTKVFRCTDDGSGIPLDGMYRALTVINSSGKYENGKNTHYSRTSGVMGCGLKAVVYLSEFCNATSYQNGKQLTYKFEDGILKDTIKKDAPKKHGVVIECKLSDKYVGGSDVGWKDIMERYSEKSYLFPDLKLKATITKDGKPFKEFKYHGKNIVDRVEEWKPDTPIINFTATGEKTVLVNITDDDLSKKTVEVELAMAFKEDVLDSENSDSYIISYGNNTKTYDGGVHVEGLKLGIQKYFKQEVIPKLKGKDKDMNIMPSDTTAGLCAFIIARLEDVEFEGQFKSRLNNPEVKYIVRDAVYNALCKEKPNVINAMVDFVKRVTRGRMASKKTRKKDVSSAFSKDRLDDFKDIVYNLNSVDPEIVIVEGKSAAGNAASARDPYNQAIYGIRRPKNVYDLESSAVNRIKSTFNDVLDICGIEAGKNCDPSKSTMNRILMLTDGDVDGDDIANSTICLLAKHCKPMVDAGMVGRILPPAYAIPVGNGKYTYVRSQKEFYDKITKAFIKKEKVYYHGTEMSKKDLRTFLEKNFNYDETLEKLANRYCTDPKLIEYLAWCYHGSVESQKRSYWINKMKRYPSIQILMENGQIVLDGDVPGADYMNIAMDEHFHKRITRFKDLQKENSSIDGYKINDQNDLTLYDVMHAVRKYMPKGIKRFKGLGELDPDEMSELCMNKETRTVVIFKFTDFDEDMKKINVMMSTKKEYADARSNILMSLRCPDILLDT